MSALLATALTCATIGGAGTAYEPGVNCREIQVDGNARQFLVYVPRRRPVTGTRAPVVFMFHGSSGDGERFLKISGWREQADATGLVAVFPTGLRYRMLDTGRWTTKWNGYGLEDKIDTNARPPADDVGFTDAMLADLDGELPIDRRRVYASGFSNGAEFTARLAVERSTVFAAAAFSAGGLYTPRVPERPIPMYLTVGTVDDRILGQTGLEELPLDPLGLLSVPAVGTIVDAHLATAGLARRPFSVLSRRRSTALRWPGTGRAVFRFTALAGLDHHYPEGAAGEFWNFFRTHPLPATGSSSTG